jgi:hypothetical protein
MEIRLLQLRLIQQATFLYQQLKLLMEMVYHQSLR